MIQVYQFSLYHEPQHTIVGTSKIVGCTTKKIHLKPAKISYLRMWQYWLGNTKPKEAFTLILNTLLQNLKKKILIQWNFLLTK